MSKALAACTCSECRALDREHPKEGTQLRLLPLADDSPTPAILLESTNTKDHHADR